MQRAAAGFTRLMIEKPFGRDSPTFNALNALTSNHFKESQLFRLDHYLGKEVLLNTASSPPSPGPGPGPIFPAQPPLPQFPLTQAIPIIQPTPLHPASTTPPTGHL